MTRIAIYDTTLRDGMQGEGMSLSAEEKVRVAHLLDDLGVGFIEAGFPSSNPKEEELFERLSNERFNADVCAFGMTRRRDVAAEDDPALRLLASTFAPVVTLVGKTWSLHLEKVVKVDPEENLRMIADSVAFLIKEGKRVIYDAEHFFDAWRDDADYALRCVRAAYEAGAENITLCDTNGATLPPGIAAAVREVVAAGLPVGIHCHNDAECGVANSLAAVAEGATLVQGTINGYGERCGNANLTSIVPNLQLKLGHECLPALEGLTEAVAPRRRPAQPHAGPERPVRRPQRVRPQGRDAHRRRGRRPGHLRAHRPRRRSATRARCWSPSCRARRPCPASWTARAAARVVERVKELEHRGFQFEAADGSLDLLIRRETGDYEPLFRLESWRVIAEKREDGRVMTEATIKIWVEGERFVRTAEGNGPVHALDQALRDAISETYPHLADIKLVNYKVRILDEAKATAAVTRVLLDASDGTDTWGAIGVHENVIEASWDALVDSLEAGMLPTRSSHRRVTA